MAGWFCHARAHPEPQNGGFASNLRDAADGLLMLMPKRSHPRTRPAKVCLASALPDTV